MIDAEISDFEQSPKEHKDAICKVVAAVHGVNPDVAISALLSVFSCKFALIATNGGANKEMTAQDLVDDFRQMLPGIEAALRSRFGAVLHYQETRSKA